jgi:hypothetical protein
MVQRLDLADGLLECGCLGESAAQFNHS